MTGTLISLGGNLETPRDSKPSDYPAVGPSGAAGMSSGSNKLVTQTQNQWMPMHTEDGGPGQPVPTDRSRVIAENFKVSATPNTGTTVSIPCSVDFSTGQMSPRSEMQTY